MKSPKPKPDNEVTELPLAVVFIKAYCGRAGKVKTETQVYTFIKRLQKAIAEKNPQNFGKASCPEEYTLETISASSHKNYPFDK